MTADREHARAAPEEWSANAPEQPAKRSKRPLMTVLVLVGCGCLSPFVLGLLAALLVPRVLSKLNAVKHAQIEADLDAIEMALIAYAANNGGTAPASLHMLAEPDRQDVVHLQHVPVDPWSRPYTYERALEPRGECRLLTRGADDLPGGEGSDIDVVRAFKLR